MHLFLSNSILPFTQTLSFFVIMLFYRWFKSHFFLSKLYSTVPNPNLPFLKYASFLSNSILPFTQTLSFFVITLFVNRVSNELRVKKFFVCLFFVFFCPNPNLPFLKYVSFFVQFYSTVHSNPIFFCHKSILPFDQLPLYYVWLLFYRWLKPHLFL